MADLPSPSDDFVPEEAITSGSQKTGLPVLVWLLGGLGCGCFSLVLLGIFSAILLPLWLTGGSTARGSRETEAKTRVQAMIRAQQAYFLENSRFTRDVQSLEIGIASDTADYQYALFPSEEPFQVFIRATPKHDEVRGYTGAVFLGGEVSNPVYYIGLCQAETFGDSAPNPALDIDMEPPEVVCPPGSRIVSE